MSHEIKTPMNGILGFLNLLKRPNITTEKMSCFIDIVNDSSKRLLNTINDIIEFSKIETEQIDIELSDLNIQVISKASKKK